jgi:hypothetical protein
MVSDDERQRNGTVYFILLIVETHPQPEQFESMNTSDGNDNPVMPSFPHELTGIPADNIDNDDRNLDDEEEEEEPAPQLIKVKRPKFYYQNTFGFVNNRQGYMSFRVYPFLIR